MGARFKTLLLALLAVAPLISQNNPVISGDNPSLQLGATKYNIGNMRVIPGSGAPGTITAPNGTALALGDFYIDTVNGVSYQCLKPSGACTGVAAANWVSAPYPDVVSVTSFGVSGNSTTDPANFQAGINATAGRTCLYIPPQVTVNLSNGAHATIPSFTCLIGGDPVTSIIQGGGAIGTGVGVLDIGTSQNHIRLEGFRILGQVTVPVGVNYSSVQCGGCGPMIALLTTGSSLWAHGNNSFISVEGVTVEHTAGYAMLFDASGGNISDVRITKVTLQNNRPHLFGTNPSFLIYGSWTSGILFHGPGSVFNFQNLIIEESRFQNNVGNALWWSNSTGVIMNRNVVVRNNTFIDTGLDPVQIAWTDGYQEYGNTVIRFGYVITSDAGSARVGGPKWLQGFNPVGYDTFGAVINFARYGNYADGNGEGWNLDGAGYGSVNNNMYVSCFFTSDPLADAANCGPSTAVGVNWTRGVGVGNSSQISPSKALSIMSNTFLGVGNSGISWFGSSGGTISSNVIIQTANNGAPIVLGNLSTNINYHAVDNLVTKNVIRWLPPTGSPAIVEDGVSVCACPFLSNESNTVNQNLILPNLVNGGLAYEFQKFQADRSGTGSIDLSTVTAGTTFNHGSMQVEGGHPFNEPAIKFYTDTGSAGTQVFQMSTFGAIPVSTAFSTLPGIVSTGQMIYCTNCASTSPCTSGGTGALAVSNGSAWNCGNSGGGGGITGSGSANQITMWTGPTSVTSAGISMSGGVLQTPGGIVAGSGITSPGFNPTGLTGSTISLQVGCTLSSGNCVSVFFAVPGGGALACPAGGPSNCTYYGTVDITGGVVRGTH